jgi:H+/gluconate symporter-like permease
MESALFWIDFFTNPWAIVLVALLSGIPALFFSAGFVWFISGIFRLNRKAGNRAFILITLIIIFVFAGGLFAINVWYRIPLGPPLDIVR